MQEDNKKFVTVSFVAAAALVGFSAHLLLDLLAAHFVFVAKLAGSPVFSNVFPVGLAAVLFGVLQFNSKTVDFMDGVVAELRKVVWPSRRDTGLMTVVVVITLLISGVLVGTYDAVWAYVINSIIK